MTFLCPACRLTVQLGKAACGNCGCLLPVPVQESGQANEPVHLSQAAQPEPILPAAPPIEHAAVGVTTPIQEPGSIGGLAGNLPLKRGLPSPVVVLNDSGSGAAAVLPAELRGFNWGGFLLAPFWGLYHQVWIALVAVLLFIPPLGAAVVFMLGIVFGMCGNTLAWQNKRWNSIEHFRSSQSLWMAAGICVWVMLLGLFVSLASFSAQTTRLERPLFESQIRDMDPQTGLYRTRPMTEQDNLMYGDK